MCKFALESEIYQNRGMEGKNKLESVYSTKVRAGKRRTYFFDVRKTKGEDFYITITESTKRFNGDGYDRHKIFLYKEDFNRFVNSMNEAVDHVKENLMPDYDYNEYEKRQQEWEAKMAAEALAEKSETSTTEPTDSNSSETKDTTETTEDDMSW